MPGAAFLRGETVTLRPVEEADLVFCRDTVNQPEVWTAIEHSRPMNRLAEREWLEETTTSDEAIVVLICVDEEPVGIVGLSDIDWRAGAADVGYLVAPDHWGNGYATEAVELLVGYALDTLRLNRVRAHVRAVNGASMRVLEKVGFTEDGVLREGDFVDGSHVDVHVFGLLADEFAG